MKKTQASEQAVALKKAEAELYDAILSLETPEEVKQFLDDLCTPTERRALVDRWRVIDAIDAQIPYRTIAEQTGVSVTTIGRVARCLTMGSGGYRLIYDRVKNSKSGK